MLRLSKNSALLLMVLAFAGLVFTSQGPDGWVYWRAAHHFVGGEPLYDFARDAPTPFKYPPWLAVFFAPLGLLSETVFYRLWHLICGLSLYWVAVRLRKQTSAPWVSDLVLLSFWGIWNFNLRQGQVVLPFLVLALWAAPDRWRGVGRASALWFALSSKVFSVLPYLAAPIRDWPRHFGVAVVVSTLATLPVMVAHGGWSETWAAFFESSASYTPQAAGGGYSFTHWICEVAGFNRTSVQAQSAAFFLALLIVGVVLWPIFRSRVSVQERYNSLLAVSVILHPMAFSYSFAWVFPAAVQGVDRSRFWGALGVALVVGGDYLPGGGSVPWRSIGALGLAALPGFIPLYRGTQLEVGASHPSSAKSG